MGNVGLPCCFKPYLDILDHTSPYHINTRGMLASHCFFMASVHCRHHSHRHSGNTWGMFVFHWRFRHALIARTRRPFATYQRMGLR